jgi:hypothetical protein
VNDSRVASTLASLKKKTQKLLSCIPYTKTMISGASNVRKKADKKTGYITRRATAYAKLPLVPSA